MIYFVPKKTLGLIRWRKGKVKMAAELSMSSAVFIEGKSHGTTSEGTEVPTVHT